MRLSELLSTIFAVALAAFAALESGNATTQQEVRKFLAAALMPQTADLGSDPGYLEGVATEAELLPSVEAVSNQRSQHQPRL
jgi:hypothetical protein